MLRLTCRERKTTVVQPEQLGPQYRIPEGDPRWRSSDPVAGLLYLQDRSLPLTGTVTKETLRKTIANTPGALFATQKQNTEFIRALESHVASDSEEIFVQDFVMPGEEESPADETVRLPVVANAEWDKPPEPVLYAQS